MAEEISKEVESQIYDGIKTKEILEIAFGLLRERKPSAVHRRDLKTALGAMISMPDFEEDVRILFRAKGLQGCPE